MRLFPAVAVILSVFLLATVLGASALAEAGESTNEGFEPADPTQEINLTVTEAGHVEWKISHRFLLDDHEIEDFDDYADSIVTGERPVDYGPGSFDGFLELAEAETEREMAIVDEGWESPTTSETEGNKTLGTISFSFTWEDFATVEGDRIYFGDAFQSPDGTWFPELHAGQELVINPPESYAFEDAPPTDTRDGALVWSGPYTFEEGELEMVLVRTGQVLGMNPLVAAGIGVAVVLVGIGSYLVARRYAVLSRPGKWPVPNPLVGVFSSSESENEGDSVPGDGAVVDFEEDGEIDEDLLSDEERVHQLLARNGGRMKQATIVEETGWSNAKVSQLLSEMADDDEIEKLRIGRENLITLPEVDPTEIE